MRPAESFHPYNPRTMRTVLFLCAIACAALAAWALADAQATGQLTEFARAGLALGLLAAFGYVFWRIRPREGWGVRVERLGLSVSRPLSGAPMELEWSQIQEVRRDGKRRQRLLILVSPEGRILLQRFLFPSDAAFDALTDALHAHAPSQSYDA